MGISNYKVYTPQKYAEIIVNLAIENYFDKEYTKKRLDNVKITDLSCGSGNLLLVALERLINISKEITGKYYFISKWITGYDIDEKALEIYKMKAHKILKKYNLSGDILTFEKDSLINDDRIRYNIVLGNPPYLGEKNNQEIFRKIKKTKFGKKYYEGKMDYFYFFIEKGIDILKEGGVLSYLTTNYWLMASCGNILRNKLKNEGYFTDIIDYNTYIFKEAVGQHNMIFSWKKNKNKEDRENFEINISKEEEKFILKNKELYDEKGNIVLACKNILSFNKKIKDKSNYKLGDICNINQGIVTGCDKAFVTKEYNEKYKEYLKPFYKNKDIFKYSCKEKSDFFIYYIEKNIELSKDLEDLFLEYKEKLSNRRDVKKGYTSWWQVLLARDKEIFSGEKIITRQRCKTNYFAYSNKDFYGSADIYYLTIKDKTKFNIFYILGYLNSEIFYTWYKNNGKHKGYNLEFYTTPLKEVPLYYPNNEKEIKYIEDLVKEQIKNYSEDIQDDINKYFEKIYIN